MNEVHPDLSAIADAFAEKVQEHDGHNSEWRVSSRVGESRRDAMGSSGADASLDIADGGIAEQVASFVIERLRAHSDGPAGYLWLVLRRVGKSGNILTSPPIRCGGEDSHAALTAARADSVAALAGMAPKALELMERITVRSMSFAENARNDELDAKVAMAQLIGAAEAGDENARWQAASEAAGSLAPVLSEAVRAWRASQGAGAPVPSDAESAVDAFNQWPAEAREGLLEALRAHMTSEGAQDGGGPAEGEP